MYQIVIRLVLIATVFLVSACNTMEGLGKDVKKGGEKIERSAEKHK